MNTKMFRLGLLTILLQIPCLSAKSQTALAANVEAGVGFYDDSTYQITMLGQSASGTVADYWQDLGFAGWGASLTVPTTLTIGECCYAHFEGAQSIVATGMSARSADGADWSCIDVVTSGGIWDWSGNAPNRNDMTLYLRYNGNASPVMYWDKGSIPADGSSEAKAYTMLGYSVTLSMVSGPPGCTFSNNILTAGTQSGDVHILATIDPDSICLVKDYLFHIGPGSCPSCSGDNCNSANNHSVDLHFALGQSGTGGSAFLQVESDTPSLQLGTPQSLQCNFIRPDIAIFTNADGSFRQIRSQDRVIDIETNSSFSYTLNSYAISNSIMQTDGSYVFTNVGSLYSTNTSSWYSALITNAPFQTVTVELVGGDTNHVRMTDSLSPAPADYFWLGNGWDLVTGNGLRSESKTAVVSGSTTNYTRTVTDSQSNIVYQAVESWQSLPAGSRLTQKVTGSGAAAQTESYTYDDSGQVIQVNHADGSWDIYVRDSLERVTSHYTPFGNTSPITNASLCRCTTYNYDDSVVAGSGDVSVLYPSTPRCTINYVLGQEVGRSYTVVKNGEQDQFQCVNPGDVWSASGNLKTVSHLVTGALHFGQPTQIVNPDETIQDFQYVDNLDGTSETITSSGQPDSSGATVVNGTKEHVWIDTFGRTTGRTVSDVGSSIITSSETYNYDDRGHLTNTTYLNGTSAQQTYDCCNVESSTAPDGTVASFGYDALKRRILSVVNGITTSNILDANGNLLGTVRYGSDGSVTTNSLSTYNDAGQLTSSTDALGNTTTYTNYFDGSGQFVKITTNPDASTRVETYYRDGSLQSLSGTAVSPLRYEYGVEADGGIQRLFTKEIKQTASGSDTGEWTKNYTDMLGRNYKTVYADGSMSQSFYNNLGQLAKQVDPDGVATLYSYNAKGQLATTAGDMNKNGVIDYGGADRITSTVSDVVFDNGTNVNRTQTFAWSTGGSDGSNLVSLAETSVDGMQSWNVVFNNGVGLTNYSRTVYDPANGYVIVTAVAPDGSSSVTTNQYGRLVSVTQYDANSVQIGQTTYGYDAQGRQSTVTDARNGATTSFYNAADQVVATLTPSPDGILAGQLTTNVLDSMGRTVQTILSDNTSVTNLYAASGLLTNTFGSRTYPVAYTYDYAGRMQTMTTWTNFASNAGAAVTTWNYDGSRGFLTNKAYADGHGSTYSYTPAGRLKTCSWARGVVTFYAYDNAGTMNETLYSDATPAVTYGYDRLGRQAAVTNGAAVCQWTYNDAGEPLTETYTGGPLNGISITNGYDGLLRRTSLSLLSSTSQLLTSTMYGYDAASRLATVSDGTNTAGYSYLANSPLVSQIGFTNNGTLQMTTTKQYDYLNRLTMISSANSQLPSSISFSYNYNTANQRTAATNVDNSHWVYQYDALGQVISGKKYWADGTPVAGQQFTYNFDDIGNRKNTAAGGDGSGLNLRSANYTANNLNQYTSRDVPGYATMIGSANSNATVTVNLQRAYRYGSYFWDELSENNAGAALYLALTNLAVLNNGTNADIVATNTGNVLLPQTPQTFLYDADGNLVSDGLWTNVWNAENRLVYVESLPTVPAAARVHEDWSYLPDGRWNQRIVSTWNGSAYVPQSTNRFVWDGQVLLAVLDQTNGLVMSFMRGLDLSGTLQGAGGVGGLLAINFKTNGTHFVAFDGNGNVSGLVNAADGTASANYEYDPFGQTLRITGSVGKLNPIRFSTQFADDNIGDLKYLFRDYTPNTGRWPNRDPLSERGAINLYDAFGNSSINLIDILGLDPDFGLSGSCPADPYTAGGSDYTQYNPSTFTWNPWRDSSFSIKLCFPNVQGSDMDHIVETMYNDLKRFKYFADPDNRGGRVFVDGQAARFRGPFWPPLDELQRIGSVFPAYTDLSGWNYVNLTYNDSAYEVTGYTQPGHIVRGVRHWQVQKDANSTSSVIVKTWAHEKTANGLDEGSRKVLNFLFGDIQQECWTDYLNNIGNHWKILDNASFVDGPYTVTY